MNIATSLQQCCDIAIMNVLKKKDIYANVSTSAMEADLKTLIHLFNENTKFEISSHAGSDLNTKKWNKVSIIPLANDLKLLKDYLLEKRNEAANNIIKSIGGERDYRMLLETVYCKLILLNRRRPGELQRLLVTTYENYTLNPNQTYEEFEEAISPTEKNIARAFSTICYSREKRKRSTCAI